MLNNIVLFLTGVFSGALMLIPLTNVNAKIVIPAIVIVYLALIYFLQQQSKTKKFLKPINYGLATTLVVGIIGYLILLNTIEKIV